jgi:hypothetical protein
MSYSNNEYSFVPSSIRLLFDNSQLEMMKTLCLVYSYYQKSKRKFVKIQEIVFYYSLVNFGMSKLIESDGKKGEVSRNLYYRYQQSVNQVVLEMANLNFIEVKGNVTSKTSQLGVRLTQQGYEFIQKMEIKYFSELISDYSRIISLVDYNSDNLNKLKGVIK